VGGWLQADCSRPVALGIAIVGTCLVVPIFTIWAIPYWTVLGVAWDGLLRRPGDLAQVALFASVVCCPAVIVLVAVLAAIRLMSRRGIPRWLVVLWTLDAPACVVVELGVLFVFIASGGGRIAH
jgi:hypothetical protein